MIKYYKKKQMIRKINIYKTTRANNLTWTKYGEKEGKRENEKKKHKIKKKQKAKGENNKREQK